MTPSKLIKSIKEQNYKVDLFNKSITAIGFRNALVGKYTVGLLLQDYRKIEIVRPVWTDPNQYMVVMADLNIRIGMAFNHILSLTSCLPIRVQVNKSETDYVLVNLETSFISVPQLYQVEGGHMIGALHTNFNLSPDVLHSVFSSREVKQFINLFHFPLSAN
jgi:hypothetical protein